MYISTVSMSGQNKFCSDLSDQCCSCQSYLQGFDFLLVISEQILFCANNYLNNLYFLCHAPHTTMQCRHDSYTSSILLWKGVLISGLIVCIHPISYVLLLINNEVQMNYACIILYTLGLLTKIYMCVQVFPHLCKPNAIALLTT